MKGYSPPLQVVAFIGTRMGDADRGPLVKMRAAEASSRVLADGDLAWVYGPRRHELARVVIDDQVPRGGVVLRDVVGAAPSELVRVIKVELDTAENRRTR